MKGNQRVIDSLNLAAEMEAELAAQYHLDQRDLGFQGLKHLKSKFDKFGENCECYLKEITDKIFTLGGSPSYSVGDIAEANSVTAILQRALDKELAIVGAFNEFYLEAQSAKDADTRNLYEHWIKWHTHKHIKWLERQLAQIKQFNESEYLLTKI